MPGRHTGSYMVFKKGPALRRCFDSAGNCWHPYPELVLAKVRWAQRYGAILDEFGKEVGEVCSQDSGSTCQYNMHVPPLRDAFARFRIIEQGIAFKNRDAFKMLRKYASCQQPGHTSTNHDRMLDLESLLL